MDLTKFSDTALYAQLENILTSPKKYVGGTIRITGTFGIYHDEETDKYYFMAQVPDSTGCCTLGMEFILEGEHSYPADYPKLGSKITVEGKLDTYKENGNQYCTLRNAVWIED